MRSRLVPLLFITHLSCLLTYDYSDRIEAPNVPARAAMHHSVVSGTAPYEYRYRILIPYTAEFLARGLQLLPYLREQPRLPPLDYGHWAFRGAYIALDFVSLFLMLGALWWLLEKWWAPTQAVAGVALAAVLTAFTFRDHYFHPWSFWEGAFFAIGVAAASENAVLTFTAVNILGALTRETTAFLPLGYFLYVVPVRQLLTPLRWLDAFAVAKVRWAVFNLTIWVLIFFVVHALVGYRPPAFFLETAWQGNTANWGHTLLLNGLLVGPLFPLAVAGVTRGPKLLKSFALALVPYFMLLLTLGYWWEIRYWIATMPVLIPALLLVLFGRPGGANTDDLTP